MEPILLTPVSICLVCISGGGFITLGVIDSHCHVTMPVGFEYADMGMRIECSGKREAVDIMSDDIAKGELDAICPDADLLIQEAECHSIWVSSKILVRHGLNDYTPDPVPGLAWYVRKDGHMTENMYEESTEARIISVLPCSGQTRSA